MTPAAHVSVQKNPQAHSVPGALQSDRPTSCYQDVMKTAHAPGGAQDVSTMAFRASGNRNMEKQPPTSPTYRLEETVQEKSHIALGGGMVIPGSLEQGEGWRVKAQGKPAWGAPWL